MGNWLSMKRFADLVARLDAAPSAEARTRLLADHLERTPDPDRGLTLGLLLGEVELARTGPAVLRAIEAQLDPVLLAVSQDVARDRAEAAALMWPGPAGETADAPTLADIVAGLAGPGLGREALAERLAAWLDRLEPGARVSLLRLAAGRLAGLVSPPLAQAAVALAAAAPLAEVERLWHAAAPPHAALLAWIDGGPSPEPAARAPFRPLAPIDPLADEDGSAAGAWAEPDWDGLRVLAVADRGERRLYSRRGVDVSARFPEILALLERDAAVEGVIVAHGPDGRLSRAALEARLARRAKPSPATLMAHDLLALDAVDLHALPYEARRARLEGLLEGVSSERITLSPARLADTPDALAALRAAARAQGAAGLVLKSGDAPYGAPWRALACEPHRLTGALLYVEWTAEGLLATVGVWEGARLVPIGKASIGDQGAAERIADYAKETAAERFGPVLQVQADANATLVLEVAFDRLERAPRRKAGIVLRGLRILGVRVGAAPEDAAELDAVRKLLA